MGRQVGGPHLGLGGGSLEVDLNFMMREPLFGVRRRTGVGPRSPTSAAT